MKLALTRFGLGLDSTLGRLTAPPGNHLCYVLEDERRKVKVPGETAIPEGTYDVKLRTEGGFHERYAKRFPEMHRGMLWLQNVPGFTWILLHLGNTDDETEGCLLLGEAPVLLQDGEFQVVRSEVAYRRVYPPLRDAVEGEGLSLTIRVQEPR